VAPNRLRFDFAHFKPLSSGEVEEIESLVNSQVRENTAVQTEVMELQAAMNSGALAFFDDKYESQVRVVEIGTFSKELCGGTHCRQTGQIGLFRIVSEGGVAAGVRRIEALTGVGALDQGRKVESEIRELAELLKTSPAELVPKTRKLLSLLKEKERELEQLKLKMVDRDSEEGQTQIRVINEIQVHAQRVEGFTMQELRLLSDKVRPKIPQGVIALGSAKDGKVSILVIVTKDLTQRIKAGDLAKEIALEVGGSGGGRADMAQAGGKFPERLESALEKVFSLVESRLT